MRALVIGGGGAKGAFAVGALKFLMNERGLEFDVLAGTSTGALITPMDAALEEEYTTVKTGDIIDGVPAWARAHRQAELQGPCRGKALRKSHAEGRRENRVGAIRG